MTFELLVYVEVEKGLQKLVEDLVEGGYSDKLSVRADENGEKEIWADVEDDPIFLSHIRQCGYISENESNIIFNKNTDTIVFY